MSKIQVTKDVANKKITVVRVFQAPQSRVWKAWTTAEQLVKWWGPKEWPASSRSFDFRVGGHWHYYMTGPDGTQAWGWLDYTAIQAMDSFSANDFFCDEKGTLSTPLPSSKWVVNFQAAPSDSTKVTAVLTFSTEEDLKKLIEMGFVEGFSSALDNLEELLG